MQVRPGSECWASPQFNFEPAVGASELWLLTLNARSVKGATMLDDRHPRKRAVANYEHPYSLSLPRGVGFR
jgi:hypothetical protein